MNINKIKNYKDGLIFSSQVLLLEAIVLFVKLLSVKWDWAQISWDMFILMAIISIYAKFIATNYSMKKAMQNTDITTRNDQIKNLFVATLNNNQIQSFDKIAYYRGEAEKVDKLLRKYSSKLQKLNHLYLKKENPPKKLKDKLNLITNVYETLLKLNESLQNKRYSEYDILKEDKELIKYIDVRRFKQKYVTSTDLFGSKSDSKNVSEYDKIKFNQTKSSMSYNLPFFFITLIFSYIYSCFKVGDQMNWTQNIIDALSLTFSIANGIFTGFSNGNKIVMQDFKTVLNERIKTIKSIINDIQYLEAK